MSQPANLSTDDTILTQAVHPIAAFDSVDIGFVRFEPSGMVIEFNSPDTDVYGKIRLSATVFNTYESTGGVYQLNCSRIHTLSTLSRSPQVDILMPENTDDERCHFMTDQILFRHADEDDAFSTISAITIDPDVRISAAEGPITSMMRYINHRFNVQRVRAGFLQPKGVFWLGAADDTDDIVYGYEQAIIDQPTSMELRSVFSTSHFTELSSALSGPVALALEDDGPIELSYPIAGNQGRVTIRVLPTVDKRGGRTVDPPLWREPTSEEQPVDPATSAGEATAASAD